MVENRNYDIHHRGLALTVFLYKTSGHTESLVWSDKILDWAAWKPLHFAAFLRLPRKNRSSDGKAIEGRIPLAAYSSVLRRNWIKDPV